MHHSVLPSQSQSTAPNYTIAYDDSGASQCQTWHRRVLSILKNQKAVRYFHKCFFRSSDTRSRPPHHACVSFPHAEHATADLRTEILDAPETDDAGVSSAPPSARRSAPAGDATKMTFSALRGLRADVLAAAEAAHAGDEVACVSAMVTATETAAVREATRDVIMRSMDAMGDRETNQTTTEEAGKATLAVVFGARRTLGLEVGELPSTDVFGVRSGSVSTPGGASSGGAPSSWPDSASALAAVGYSEGGWESLGTRDAAATATPNPNPGAGPSPLSVPVPGDAASQLVTSSTVHVFTNAGGTVHRVSPTHGRSEDEAATPKRYDLESDEMMEQDLTGGTQIIPGDEDEEIIEDVGGTQVEPEDAVEPEVEPEDDTPRAAVAPKPSPRSQARSPVGAPPSFLRLVSRPAATLRKRLSMDAPYEIAPGGDIPATIPGGDAPPGDIPGNTPMANPTDTVPKETPRSLWTAAAATSGFKTPPGDATTTVVVDGTSPFPLSAHVPNVGTEADGTGVTQPMEIIPETAAAAFETEKTEEAEPLRCSGDARPTADPSFPFAPSSTPAEVMCSYIPSTFPHTSKMTFTESTAGGSAAGVHAVAAAAAEEADEELLPLTEMPMTEVPSSVAPSPGAGPPRRATGGALAAAMHARRRRDELGAAGASLSLGPPADDAEADETFAVTKERNRREEVPVFDASQPEPFSRSAVSHGAINTTNQNQHHTFTPFDLTVPEVGDDEETNHGDGDGDDDLPVPDDDVPNPRVPRDPATSGFFHLESVPAETFPPRGDGWAGGWGRVAGDRRGDRAAPPKDVNTAKQKEDPTQESPPEEEEEDAEPPASPDFFLMLSQQVRDIVASAAADAPSQSMVPPPLRRPSTSAAATGPPTRRNSSIAAQANMQRLWDAKEARDAADSQARRSGRDRVPRKFFGDSQFPSQSQGDSDVQEEDGASDEEDGDDVSDPESKEAKATQETGTTPLARRRAPRRKKPRKFFGDSQYPSQSQGDSEMRDAAPDEPDTNSDENDDDEDADDDNGTLEICESDEDEAPWYVGGTQAVPETGGWSDDDDSDEEAPPPMDDDDDENGDEASDKEAEDAPAPLPAKRARRASARVPGSAAPKTAKLVEKTSAATLAGIPKPKGQTKSKGNGHTKGYQNWKGPLPIFGCPKCRHAQNGCGRCKAIRAHAEFGTPLPWRLKTVGGSCGSGGAGLSQSPRSASLIGPITLTVCSYTLRETDVFFFIVSGRVLPSSAPAALGVKKCKVRFHDENVSEGAKKGSGSFGSVGTKRRRTSAVAVRSSISSLPTAATGSAKKRKSHFESKVSNETPDVVRRRAPRASFVFHGLTFLISGLPSKQAVDDLTDLIETHGGVVRIDVPPPAATRQIAPENAYQPSQDVGAPMVDGRRTAPGRNTRVITPAAGRTLKCLYAAAVGAPLLTPDWVRDSVDTGSCMALGEYRVDHDDDDDDASVGGLFDGVVVSLSGDVTYVRQFGLLLRHAGAEVVPVADLVSTVGENVAMGEGPCDYVLVQVAASDTKTRVEGGVQRASKRLGVPCVSHEWAVDSLLANKLAAVDGRYRVK